MKCGVAFGLCKTHTGLLVLSDIRITLYQFSLKRVGAKTEATVVVEGLSGGTQTHAACH